MQKVMVIAGINVIMRLIAGNYMQIGGWIAMLAHGLMRSKNIKLPLLPETGIN